MGLLEGLFLHSPVPYAVFSKQGQCLLTNPAYQAMFGAVPPPEYNVFQDEVTQRQGISGLIRRAFQGETVQTPVFWYDLKELRHIQMPQGRRVAISCTFFPLSGAGGAVQHVAIAYKDLTAELTIRDAEEERLRHILKVGGLGYWRLELKTGALYASEGCKLNFGLPPDGELSSYEKLRSLIHPDDRASMQAAVDRALSQREDYTAEYRVLAPAGAVRWVVARGRVLLSEDGTPAELSGITLDVTELKRAQERLGALADISTALSQATVDFSAALEELARLGAGSLGECCVLTLLNEEADTLEVVAAYHPEPEARQLLKNDLYGAVRGEGGVAMRVLRTGQPILQERIPQEGLLEAVSPGTRRFIERFGLHSSLLVPLRVQGKVIGTLGVSRGRPDHPYTLEDQDFLQGLSDRAALTIQNVRLLKTAQEAVRLRDEFLSVASHELKTPLTPLSLKLQGLERMAGLGSESEFAERLARDVETMRRQVKRLTDLINDLLDVARISGGRLKLRLEEVELTGLVREVVSRFEPEAERVGGRIQVRVGEPFSGHWDRLRLEQVVTNLLSNALKYGPGKPIRVEVGAQDGQARLTVRDEGIGVEPRLRARIFEKFERAVSDRHYGGLGLGLYITRQIVEALGGSIEVQSVLQQGATFTVLLPLTGPGAG
jgi:PAS domain S-box-containing protein